ncbi:MAG: hypothetical protein WCK89_11970, partial [bacterium]
ATGCHKTERGRRRGACGTDGRTPSLRLSGQTARTPDAGDAAAEREPVTVQRRTQGGEPRPGGNTKTGSPGDWTPGARCEPRRCPALYGCA